MKLTLHRFNCGQRATLGELFVDKEFTCFTIEDQDRQLETGGEKIPRETCIPRGSYPVVVTWSNRFKRELPLVKDVPGFDGIRIHPGNTHDDTEGCILVGSSWFNTADGPAVNNSRATFGTLFERLEAAYARGEAISLEVI
jgi:hypothetical protein